MNEQDFAELMESIKQAGQIKRGELEPVRKFEVTPLDIKTIRQRLHKTQHEFALMLGVSVSTLQDWEQGKRQPSGPARALLQIADKHPEIVEETLAPC